jgi:hypothetical protein
MPVDPELQEQLDDIKNIIRSEAVGSLLVLMFFMSCSQCNKIDNLEQKINRIEHNMPQR